MSRHPIEDLRDKMELMELVKKWQIPIEILLKSMRVIKDCSPHLYSLSNNKEIDRDIKMAIYNFQREIDAIEIKFLMREHCPETLFTNQTEDVLNKFEEPPS